jgi:hypothetical protein
MFFIFVVGTSSNIVLPLSRYLKAKFVPTTVIRFTYGSTDCMSIVWVRIEPISIYRSVSKSLYFYYTNPMKLKGVSFRLAVDNSCKNEVFAY